MVETIIPKEKIISGRAIPTSTGSYGHAAPTMNPIHLPNGDLIYGVPTSNNSGWVIHDFGKNGYASPQIDDGVGRGQYRFAPFDSWKAGSKPPAMNEYVIIPPTETIAIGSFRDNPWQTHEGQSPLFNKFTREFHVSRINDAGRMASELYNAEQRVKRYDKTQIAQELGGKMSEGIGYLARGGLPEGALYGVFRAKDGKVVLAVSKDMYEWASLEARELGIDTEVYLETVLAEEHAHIKRRSFDKKTDGIEGIIAEEFATKDMVQRAYSRLAKGAEGGNPRNPKYQRARRRLQVQAALKKADMDSVDRYRKVHGYNSRAIADESDKSSFTMTEDGKIAATYENVVAGRDGAEMPTYLVGNYLKERTEETGRKIDPSQIKSMNDVKERQAQAEPKEAEAANAEASASN